MKPAVFLDRDGILNEVIKRGDEIGSPRSVAELTIVDEGKFLVEAAKKKGFFVGVVTNQPDVAKRKMYFNDMEKINSRLLKEVPVDEIQVCTSGDERDYRKKPNPGMLFELANMHDLDLEVSYIVGDDAADVEAGRRAGVKTILLCTDYNREFHGAADHNFCSIREIVNFISDLSLR